MLGVIQEQLDTLRAEGERHGRWQGVSMGSRDDGSYVVSLTGFVLPEGWSRPRVDIAFLLPVGYPMARPETFWANGDLRLANEGMPFQTDWRRERGIPNGFLWFAWRPTAWHPNRDNLATYVAMVGRRFHHKS